MTNFRPIILSNLYLIRRSLRSASKSGIRHMVSIILVGIVYFECIFFQQYLQQFIRAMEQEITKGDLRTAQMSLDGNQLLIMQFSLGRDIFSFLIVIIIIYILFDFRNKFSLIKEFEREDVKTRLYLGVYPKYVIRELLLKNVFLYMKGLLFSCVICIFIDMRLVRSFNSILPYNITADGKNAIWLSMLRLMFAIFIGLGIYSILIEFTSIQRFKRTFSFY